MRQFSFTGQALLGLIALLSALVLPQTLSNGDGLAWPAQASGLDALTRDLEPVVVRGVFLGAPVDQLFVYRANGSVWEQIPFQVDEVTASGEYTTAEDGLIDANDEIVFMAKDLGNEASAPISASLPISPTWYKFEVADPLAPSQKGWAYIVRSTALSVTNPTDYVDYVASNQRINATNYALGWATDHPGLDYMTLFGSGDILDRTKLRVKGRIGFIPFTLTEEDLPAADVVLIRDGPVRVILQRGTAVTLAYASFLCTTTLMDLTQLPSNLVIDGARISTDLASTAIGGTFYNENVPLGVTIDGLPDSMSSTTLTQAWRQVSLDSGTMIQVMDLGSPGGTLSHYYRDDSTFDTNDTGDGRSYGDSGITVTNPTARSLQVVSAQYVLSGRQPNRGGEFYAIFQNPLQVSWRLEGGEKAYLPIILGGR